MLLAVHQEDPDAGEHQERKHQERPDDVSEEEWDLLLATMGTTSMKESDMELLQNDLDDEEDLDDDVDEGEGVDHDSEDVDLREEGEDRPVNEPRATLSVVTKGRVAADEASEKAPQETGPKKVEEPRPVPNEEKRVEVSSPEGIRMDDRTKEDPIREDQKKDDDIPARPTEMKPAKKPARRFMSRLIQRITGGK